MRSAAECQGLNESGNESVVADTRFSKNERLIYCVYKGL